MLANPASTKHLRNGLDFPHCLGDSCPSSEIYETPIRMNATRTFRSIPAIAVEPVVVRVVVVGVVMHTSSRIG